MGKGKYIGKPRAKGVVHGKKSRLRSEQQRLTSSGYAPIARKPVKKTGEKAEGEKTKKT